MHYQRCTTAWSQASQVPSARCCIRLADLRSFEQKVFQAKERGDFPDACACCARFRHKDANDGPNMYQVNEHFIKPVTKGTDSSYALLLHPAGLPIDVFISHAWVETVDEITDKCVRAWPLGAQNLWCCSLSMPQNSDISALLNVDLLQTPFACAIQSAQWMIVVPNKVTSIYTRLWCVLEASLAIEHNLEIVLPEAVPSRTSVQTVACVMTSGLVASLCSFACLVGWNPPKWIQAGAQMPLLYPDIQGLYSSSCLVLFVFFRFLLRKCAPVIKGSAEMAVLGILVGGAAYNNWKDDGEDSQWSAKWRVVQRSKHCLDIGLAVSIIALMCKWVLRRLRRAMVRAEAVQLDFTSVRDAVCSHEEDERRIRRELLGKEDDIDAMINVLRDVGAALAPTATAFASTSILAGRRARAGRAAAWTWRRSGL
eukprot:TRINITY_DN31982_c0_g1_i1.p1 TRINITY_DN31982_c0_g1~~TRINITY_DN31982_c0_g1_i1.p1  ORF type:complete len:426 (-),score=101.22 TRINITY_DN31982_c0_g1_i1:131-1408(-)